MLQKIKDFNQIMKGDRTTFNTINIFHTTVIFRIIGQEKRIAELINRLPFGKMTGFHLKRERINLPAK